MKRILFLSLFIISNLSEASCHLYEIKGEVNAGKDFVDLITNKDTRSEKKLRVHAKEVKRFVPYFNLTIHGSFILKSPIDRGSEILHVESIKEDIPDPLNHKLNSFIKKIKEVKCP